MTRGRKPVVTASPSTDGDHQSGFSVTEKVNLGSQADRTVKLEVLYSALPSNSSRSESGETF